MKKIYIQIKNIFFRYIFLIFVYLDLIKKNKKERNIKLATCLKLNSNLNKVNLDTLPREI